MNNDQYKRRSHDRETRDIISHGSDGGRAQANKYDDPPNSRLFIVCGKSITEDDFKDAFEPYGIIEEIWVLKDRVTNEPKGVTYIKFSKTSEAALAMEEMNGRCIGSHPRPLKVLIAHSRDQGSRREMNEEERLVRLFVVVPKSMGESELRDNFNQFGDVDYVSIVRDRTTKESKGFAYIKYHRMSHAAKAFEACERSFKPVFADPKPQKSGYHEGNGGDRMNGPGSTTSASTTASVSAGYDMLSYMDTSHSNPDGNCRLNVITSPIINQDQLWRLFDLVPGLDYCELKRPDGRGRDRQNKAFGTVVFNNPQPNMQPPGETYDPSYCSVKLPAPQPLAPMDSVVAERLFIVCTPSPPALYALKDVFGRFGGLIDIYLLNGKTCGYAKYAGKESAEKAVSALHGQEVCGARLKVMPADPQDKNDNTRKRPKMMEQD